MMMIDPGGRLEGYRWVIVFDELILQTNTDKEKAIALL